MKRSVPFQRIALAVALAVGAVFVPVATSSTPVSAAACTLCAGGEYHPLTPGRIFDTRDGLNDVAPLGAKPLSIANSTANPTFDVQLLDVGGIPAVSSDVLAVAVNITVVLPTHAGYLEAYPSGPAPEVHTSILNFAASDTVPNMALLRPGPDGKVTIGLKGGTGGNGSAHVLIDVFGWWSTSAYAKDGTVDDGDERGARLITIPSSPGRIVDTRAVGNTKLQPDSDRTVQIRGATRLGTTTQVVPPGTEVVGVLINVTSVLPSTATYLSLVPEAVPAGTRPGTSNLNVSRLQVKANLVLVPVGDDGNIHVYNLAGTSDLVIDVMAYLIEDEPEATRRGRVVPLTSPFRAFDTREPGFGGVPLGPGQAEDWSFANFAASVNVGGVSVGKQSAALGNLTNASLTRQYPSVGVSSYLSVCPAVCPLDGTSNPTYSNLNSVEGWPVPNMAIVPYGTDYAVRVFNKHGYSHYLFDVSAVVLAD